MFYPDRCSSEREVLRPVLDRRSEQTDEDPGCLHNLPNRSPSDSLVLLLQRIALLFTASLFPHGWPDLTLLRLQKLKGSEVRKNRKSKQWKSQQ